MITLRKLATLPRRTRLRKAVRLLDEFEERLRRGLEIERLYLRDLAGMLADEGAASGEETAGAGIDAAGRSLAELLADSAPREKTLRLVNNLRHALLAYLGETPGEWDLRSPRDFSPEPGAGDLVAPGATPAGGRDSSPPGFSPWIYLEDLRSPFNVGAIFRSAEAYCVDRILLSPATPSPASPRARRSSMGCVDRVSWEWCDLHALFEASEETGRPIFALEIGGEAIDRFPFPAGGIVLVGNEELGLSPEARALAQGRICSIPMAGAKASLNVAVSVGILLQAWWSRTTGLE